MPTRGVLWTLWMGLSLAAGLGLAQANPPGGKAMSPDDCGPGADPFVAARARFEAAARAGRAAGEAIDISPVTQGDGSDKVRYAALRTGALLAFQAGVDRQVILRGFASPEQVARIPPVLQEALAAGQPADGPAPDLVPLLAAADLGGPEALPYKAWQPRLKHLFHFGQIGRLCPLQPADDGVARLRFQLTVTATPPTPGGPSGPIAPSTQRWITLRYHRDQGTATLSTGDEGC